MNPGPVLVVIISMPLIVQTKKFLVETEGKFMKLYCFDPKYSILI